jgi:hypothetical protein
MHENRRELAITLGVGAFAAMFLVFFRAVELSSNSLNYALEAQVGTLGSLLYAPHLGYAATVRVFGFALGVFGNCNMVCAGQAHTIIWAVTSVVCLYLIVRNLTGSISVGLTGAAALLIGNGFWVYATQLEVYVPTVGALLLLAAILFLASDKLSTRALILSCAVLWTIATLFHQGTAVFAVPIVAYFIAAHGRKGVTTAAAICLLAGGAVISAYGIAYAFIDAEQPFLAWMIGLATTDLVDWGSLGNFGLSGFQRALRSQGQSLLVIPGALRSPQYTDTEYFRVGLVIVGVLGWSIVQTVRRASNANARLFFLLWFCVYFLFFTWWDPRVLKFFVPSAVAIVALGSFALHDIVVATDRLGAKLGSPRWMRRSLLGVAVSLPLLMMFTFNLVGSVLPLRGNIGPALGPHYLEARRQAALVPEECVVSGYGHHLLFLSYYAYSGGDQHRGRSNRIIFETYFEQVLDKHPRPTEPGRLRTFSDEPCVLINLSFLADRWFSWKTRPAVFPVASPAEAPDWHNFLEWYFQAVPSEDGQTMTYDSFSLLVLEGRAYLLVDRRQREQGPRDHLWRTIEEYVESYGDEFESSYPGRDRELIFGYGGSINTASPARFRETLWDFVKDSRRAEPLPFDFGE